jgi:threonine efflux protein
VVAATFIAVWLGILAAQASPGPNMFAVAETALSSGRRPALMVVLGIGSGAMLWSVLAALGMGALFAALPLLLTVLKFVGGAYLLYMGWRALRAAWRGGDTHFGAGHTTIAGLVAWRRGFLVVMTNPKAALMWVAITTVLYGAGLGNGEVLLFGPVTAISALGIYGFYAWLFSTGTATRNYARFWRGVEAVFGTAFGAFGASLVVSGMRDIRP